MERAAGARILTTPKKPLGYIIFGMPPAGGSPRLRMRPDPGGIWGCVGSVLKNLPVREAMEVCGITRKMIYLCIGRDIERLDRSVLEVRYFRGIRYYEVEGFRLIKSASRIYCSCNESYCWHVFKLVVGEKDAVYHGNG